MKRALLIALSSFLMLSAAGCGNSMPEPITFENETEMLSYLSNNNWRYNVDNSNNWIVFSDDGFGEFSNSDDLGYGQFITMSPQEGTFKLCDEQYIISSDTGDIVNCSNSQENYKLCLSSPDIEIGGEVLKKYVYSKRSPDGSTLVSVQLTNTGERTYKSIGFDITLSDDNNNSVTLESDCIDLLPGESGSCSAYSDSVPYEYTNITTTMNGYSTSK